jgi:hypothetical protein
MFHADRIVVPVLLRHLRYREPSALDERLAAWDHRLPWLDWRWKRRHHLPMVALAAFEILNTNATSAIPELSRRLWAGGEAWLLVPALQSIGPASIPTLVEALDAEEIDTRVRLIHALGSLGEHAAPARPRFHQLLHDPGVPVPVRHAVASVWFESGSPEAGDIAQIESFLHDPQLHDAAALGLARAGQAGWRVLLCRLESPETNSIPLLAALTVGAELEWARGCAGLSTAPRWRCRAAFRSNPGFRKADAVVALPTGIPQNPRLVPEWMLVCRYRGAWRWR